MTFNVEFEVCVAWSGLAGSESGLVWRRGVKMICQRGTPSVIKRKQLECIYVQMNVSATVCIVFVSVSAARTSWATCCT